MTDVLKLSDGTTDLDLMFSSAPGFQLLAGGLKFATPEHENLYHSSEWQDGEELARHKLENRIWPMKLALKSSSSDDNIANELIKLNRLIKQARRYQLKGDVSKVYLHIKLDGATNWTRFVLIDAVLESADIFSYFNRKSGDVKFDGAIGLELTTTSFGYGAETILANELGTPHFEEDGDSDGLADQWNEAAGTETTSLDTTTYLLGTQSQEVITNTTSSHGIYSDTVTVSGVDDIASYAWLFCTSGSDEVTLDVQADSTGSIGTATYSAATETDTGANSNTWKRLDVIGSTTASDTTLTMRVERLSGGASKATTFYIDKTYLQLDATAIPDGWMSCRYTENHRETVTEGAIPYIDFDDIPGDLEADTVWDMDCRSGSSITHLQIGKKSKQGFEDTFDYFDSFWDTVDASRTENGYKTTDVTTAWTLLPPASFASENMPGTYNILAAMKGSAATTGDVKMRYYSGSATAAESLSKPISISTNWRLYTIGPIKVKSYESVLAGVTYSQYVRPVMKLLVNTTVSTDFYCYMPLDEQQATIKLKAAAGNDWSIILSSNEPEKGFAYDTPSSEYKFDIDILGQIPSLTPNEEQRVIIMPYSSTHTLAEGNIETEIRYKPHTEFLLGTE